MLFRRHPHPARRYQIYLGDFGPDPDLYPSRFLRRFGEKFQKILVLQAPVQLLQIWSKRHWCARKAYVIGFPTGLFSELREVELSPVVLPIAVLEVPGTGSINCGNYNARLACIIDGRLQVRILGIART